ncbi:MAG: cell division protein ZipA [Lentisphaeria bacterium]
MNKDWLTAIIVLLIIGIVLDGVRRMRLARRQNLRLSKNAKKADKENPVQVSTSEFPSGGARVAAYRGENDVEQFNKTVRKKFETGRVTVGAPQRIPEQVALNLEESVPMLMDSVELEEHADEGIDDLVDPAEPRLGSFDDLDDDSSSIEEDGESISDEVSTSVSGNEAESRMLANEDPPSDKTGLETYESVKPSRRYEEDPKTEDIVYDSPEEVLIINIMAKSGERFQGPDLLETLVEEGMKLGAMDIFHRHLDNDGDAPVVFSLANMVVPGTFNLAAMAEFETPGVSMFLSLPVAGESLAAYNDLAVTARNIATKIGGELKDENRSVMTSQTIEHGRQRVIEYERKKKLARV